MRYVFILVIFICFLDAQVSHFVRYEHNGIISYGKVKGDFIQALKGDIFGKTSKIGELIPKSKVKLLIPTTPNKVFAVGMNFASHLASPSNMPPPLFLKLPTSLIASNKDIYLPKDASNVHFEGELVLVIGKKAKNISQSEVDDVIFGVSVGNDLTERNWQFSDLQWMRSKASDGFGPIGPIIATGVDYNDVVLTTKLNGKVVQKENTKYMIHSPAKVVSYLSRYFTLLPGDLIYMGTPGRTQALKDGDVVSVEIENIGIVKNTIKVK